ncbi:hypothetical protein [Pseudomonas sp. SDO55104_S430]
MSISDNDWKKYKELSELALDRFCRGVLADAQTIAQNETLSAHARYRTLYRLMRNRDKDLASAFNTGRRSEVSLSLMLMVAYDLLSDEDLSVLSEDLRARIADAVRKPYVIEWAEEP